MQNKIVEEELSEKCDHDVCHCVPEKTTAVVEGKSVYCSEGCRSGRGCAHTNCNCSTA